MRQRVNSSKNKLAILYCSAVMLVFALAIGIVVALGNRAEKPEPIAMPEPRDPTTETGRFLFEQSNTRMEKRRAGQAVELPGDN